MYRIRAGIGSETASCSMGRLRSINLTLAGNTSTPPLSDRGNALVIGRPSPFNCIERNFEKSIPRRQLDNRSDFDYDYLEFKIYEMRTTMKSLNLNDEELSLKLLIVFSRAFHSVAEKIKEDIRSHNLNPTEFAVLELLYHKGDQPIQQIGKKILLSSGSITYVVDKLEKKGLVFRKNCPKDRRVIYAVVADRGKQLMKEIFPKHKKAVQQIFSALEPDEKRSFISLLKKLGFSLEP